MKLAASLLALVFCARVATAQPVVPPPAPPPVVASDGDLSPGTAVLLSAGATVASWTVMIAAAHDNSRATEGLALTGALGTMIGPSLGHWYARDYLTVGLGVRVLGAGAMLGGAATAFRDLFDFDGNRDDSGAAVLLVGGLIAYGAGSVYDIATAGSAATRYNAHRHQLAVAPLVNPTSGSYGLALGGQF